MNTLLKASPKHRFEGIRDDSGGDIPVVPEQIPTHLPHFFLFTPEGPEVELVGGAQWEETFGNGVLSLTSKYTTHQTALAQRVNARANAAVVQRLKPEDANPPATVTVSLEVVSAELDEYERDADGSVVLDQNGDPVTTGTTTTGYEARFLVSNIDPTDETISFGTRAKTKGELVGLLDAQSDVYPLFDLEVSSFGSHGNLKGFRLWAPTEKDPGGTNTDLIYDQMSYLFKMQMIQRPNDSSQPRVVETMTGAQDIDVMFKPGAMDETFNLEKYIEDVAIDQYRDMDVLPRKFGPFDKIHVYQSFIDEVLTVLYDSEKSNHADWPTDATEGMYLFNMIGGTDVDGNMYYTYRLLGADGGSSPMNRNTNHYAYGGSDGTMDYDSFNSLVKNAAETFDTNPNNFLDDATWPQSVFYDSGFSLETKKSMLGLLGMRDDIAVITATQDVMKGQNTVEEESSSAIALRTQAEAYPESMVHGTPVCRAMVIGQSGWLLNSMYKKLLPLTVDFADKAAMFMGAGNGVWAENRGWDMPPYNQITMFKDVNHPWKPQGVYDNDWDNGMVWVQKFDRSTLFYPQTQTVYSDSTSVLNSSINMFVMIETIKVTKRVWRELTGISKLTRAQFIERSNRLIREKLDGRFDDRVRFDVDTFFTSFDGQLGYSWSTNVTVYLNNMRTVGTTTIVSDRRANFEG